MERNYSLYYGVLLFITNKLQNPIFLDLECSIINADNYQNFTKLTQQKLFIYAKNEGMIMPQEMTKRKRER